MSDIETLGVYAAQAEKYAIFTKEVNHRDPILAAFMQALPPGGHVLDLGCGPGTSAAEMAANGFQVTATDAVEEMVALAKKHDGVTAHVATFDDIQGSGIYDGIWANFSLLHASKADMPRHLNAIAQSLKPNGIFHIGMKTGSGEKRDTIGRNYSYYEQDELSALLADVGLSVTEAFTGEAEGLDGVMAKWICLRAVN